MESPDRRLAKLLDTLPPVALQNRLMRLDVRSLAVSALYLHADERRALSDALPAEKARLWREELAYCRRLRIDYPRYRRMIEKVIRGLETGKVSGGRDSWIAPKGREPR